jgi:Peptidase family M28
MRPLETIRGLTAFERRGPGTDAERRAARWLAGERIGARLRVRVETFWCRPNWAMAHAWHVALALVGSLLAPSSPTIGAILLAIALGSTISDEVTGVSLGRRLTPERASQNVVATAASPKSSAPEAKTPLIITANYDAGRTALVYRDPLRGAAARLRNLAGPAALGWLAWLSIAIAWLLAVAIVRTSASGSSTALGLIQLPPTVGLVLGLALLLEAAGAPYGPAANDNASGIAVATALIRALAQNPPDNLAVELVLAGAGNGGEIGIRRYLRIRRRELRRANAIVIGIAPSGTGHLHYWRSDGRLVPLGYARPLRALASEALAPEALASAALASDAIASGALGANPTPATPHRDRGASPAQPARARGLAAIAIGCLDQRGVAPRSHQANDDQATIDEATLDRTATVVKTLIDAIDASLAAAGQTATPA